MLEKNKNQVENIKWLKINAFHVFYKTNSGGGHEKNIFYKTNS